ncbi:MAG: group I intron-associated PD-(D/E)XK endonuclease [Acidobacteriota bacterium]
MLKYETGNKSEAIVLSAYLSAGFTVSIPFGSGVIYDLLVDNGSKIFKNSSQNCLDQKRCRYI